MPRSLLIGFIAALAAALGLALSLMLAPAKTVNLATGTWLPQPRGLPAFSLTDANGSPFTKANVQGHWTLVFVGFTSCPDVCPTTLNTLKNTRKAMGEAGKGLNVLLLSVDPERDTPARLKAYVQAFDPSFNAATGPTPVLDTLAQAMSFVYTKVPGATPSTYTLDHSAALMLLNPQGQLTAFFTPPFKASALAADLSLILQKKT